MAAGRPSKTTNKRQLILGFERRERRGRRFRVKTEKQETSMKSRKFHEIPRFRGISVKSHDAAGGEKRKRGGPRGGPLLIRIRTNRLKYLSETIAVFRRIPNSERISRFPYLQGFSASQNQA